MKFSSCLRVFITLCLFSLASAQEDIISLYEKAQSGDAQAQYELGMHYLKGDGIKKDAAKALGWYRKAAEQGHALAKQTLELVSDLGLDIAAPAEATAPIADKQAPAASSPKQGLSIQAPTSLAGKRIRFTYSDTRYREGECDDETYSWGEWHNSDLSKDDVWVQYAAPAELLFSSADRAILNPTRQHDGHMLVYQYQSGDADTAIIYRKFIEPKCPSVEDGEYVLSFDTPTSGTATLRNCFFGDTAFVCENIQFVIEDVRDDSSAIEIPKSLAGKKIHFIYSDAICRDGRFSGGKCSWNVWQNQNLLHYSGWKALAAPHQLVFSHGNKGIYNPGEGSEDDYKGVMLAGTYQAGQGDKACIHRELTYDPNATGDASGEYILTFGSPTSGTAELKNCVRGESCFECENIIFVIEEERNSDTEPASAKGWSEAEKAELKDFIGSLEMFSSKSSSIYKLGHIRLEMLLPMILEGAPVDVTTEETKGRTALHYACIMRDEEIVEWLVNHGADVNKKADKGETPLDCVSSGYNADEIRRILLRHGAVKGQKR